MSDYLHRMPFGEAKRITCEVSKDQQTARLYLPPLQLSTERRPINIYLDIDAEAVDALLQQLSEARTHMLPPPRRN